MMTIEKNRAHAFLSALEVLRKNTDQVIEHMKLNTDAGGLSEEESEKRREELGAEPDAISCFDDALIDVLTERNRFVEEAELDALQVGDISWKEVKR